MTPRMSPWTLDGYRRICEAALSAGYKTQSIVDYLRAPADGTLILRHDVDRFPGNALRMGRLEHSLGIRSTYYFRMIRSVFAPDLIAELRELGHEIGYHYETLSRCNGQPDKAVALFTRELGQLRALAEISTIAAHGSPLSPWDNRTLWTSLDRDALQLEGDAYDSIDYAEVAYFTDTGRSWDADSTNLRDRPPGAVALSGPVRDAEALIRLLSDKHLNRVCLQTHPERWSSGVLELLRSKGFDTASSGAKQALRLLRRKRG